MRQRVPGDGSAARDARRGRRCHPSARRRHVDPTPEAAAEGRPLSIPARLTIERVGAREVHISGGESPHTAERPFIIDLDEVRDTPHVVDWMSRIALHGWGATPVDLFTLARLLLDAIGERQEPPSDD